VPVESVARTVRPRVLPESAGTVRYVVFVAPWIAEQCAPSPSQRYHWYLYVRDPMPAQRPVEPVSWTPRLATPRIAGGAEWEGPATSPPIAIGEAVLSAAWVVVPNPACTSATSACPTSAAATVYALAFAPAIAAQTRPFALHRRHA
jgi:hypothetical protein